MLPRPPFFRVKVLVLLPALLFAQTDWSLAPQSRASGYTVEVRHAGCRSAVCAVLAAPAPETREAGILTRKVDAAPYRGQAVRLRAAVRLEDAGPDGRARLWMRVNRRGGEPGFYDDMGDRPIVARQWSMAEIEGDVPADAESIEFGLLLSGRARAWVDEVALDRVPPSDPALRRAMEAVYASIDRAYAAGNADEIANLALPGAQVRMPDRSEPLASLIGQVREQMRRGAQYRSRSAVTAVRGSAEQAVVWVRNETSIISPAFSQTVDSASRDTWAHTANGWKLKQSVLIEAEVQPSATGPQAAQAVIAELRQRAVPLPEGMEALATAVRPARIVALGEASYGTREFAELNRRIIERLIRSKGFTVVAIEANWAEARAVDDYIRTGRGDPRAAIDGLNAWPWEVPQVLDLVQQMRAWNAAPGPHATVSFAGIDIAPSPAAERLVIDYLKRYAPEEAGPAELAYSEARDPARAATAAAGVARMLDTKHRDLVAASSPALWRDARQAAQVAWQSRTMQMPGKGVAYRSEALAANLEWLAAEAHAAEKIVLWTHNANVAGTPGGMAEWLRRRYGKQLYTIGYAFRAGELRAVTDDEPAVHTAPPAPEGSGGVVLGGAGIPQFFLDLSRLPEGPLENWLAQPHLFHQTGVWWDDSLVPLAPGTLYDGLIFVDQTHAVEPM